MATVQTSVARNIGALVAGYVPDQGPTDVLSAVNTGSVNILPGNGVKRGSTDGSVELADDAADVFLGVAMLVRSESPIVAGDTPDTYKPGTQIAVFREGRILVECVGTVAAGAAAYIVPATGKFTSTSTNNIATGGTFNTSGTDAVVELQL